MTERSQDGDVVHRRERARADASEVSWAVRALQRAQVELDRVLARHLGLRALDYTAMPHLMEARVLLGPVELAARLGIFSDAERTVITRYLGAVAERTSSFAERLATD